LFLIWKLPSINIILWSCCINWNTIHMHMLSQRWCNSIATLYMTFIPSRSHRAPGKQDKLIKFTITWPIIFRNQIKIILSFERIGQHLNHIVSTLIYLKYMLYPQALLINSVQKSYSEQKRWNGWTAESPQSKCQKPAYYFGLDIKVKSGLIQKKHLWNVTPQLSRSAGMALLAVLKKNNHLTLSASQHLSIAV